MADQSLSTQSALDAVYFQLTQLADNLAAHANAPLGIAHGFNFFHPLNFTDQYANAITSYVDDADNTVGDLAVTINIGGVRYFCPAKLTTLDGQTPMSGLPAEITAFLTASNGADETNWVTNFASALATYVNTMNAQYLLPHARLGYWESHRNVTAAPRTWTDSAGHVVGDVSVKIPVGGTVYEIPARTTLGGTVKPWLNFKFCADYDGIAPRWYYNVYLHANDDNQVSYFYFTDDAISGVPAASGTLPRAIRLLVNKSPYGTDPTWFVMPPGSAIGYVKQLFSTFLGSAALFVTSYNVSGDSYKFTILDANGSDNTTPAAVLRLLAIAYTTGQPNERRYSLGNLCCFRNNDEDGGWTFFPIPLPGGAAEGVSITREIPTLAWWGGAWPPPTTYYIGQTYAASATEIANLEWHASDPLAP